MPRKNSCSFKRVLLTFLLMFSVFCRPCEAQVNREEANKPPDGHGGDSSAFFALRSCHQLLHGDAGEFFSPDYLCSNPPLWCNWTIQVDPAKRIHLHLEDLTPDDACRLKEDQIHVDEPAGHFQGHRVLQQCWREAKFTSSSNTVYVVLLIGGWPSPPYRGFYGRYQAFGPPVVYNPQEDFPESEPEPDPGLVDSSELVVEQTERPSPADTDLVSDHDGRPSAMTAELQPADAEGDENLYPASENLSLVSSSTAGPTVPASTQGTSRSGRGAAQTPPGWSDSAVPPTSPRRPDSQNHEPEPTTSSREPVEEAAGPEEETPGEGADSDQLPAPSEAPEPEETQQTHPHPNMVEPLSDHRGNLNVRNHSELPHLPGDHLFEASVEVNFSQDVDESWDDLSKLLLHSVKALIGEQLKALHTPLSVTPKRIKRLSRGVLYILWLQIGQVPGGLQVHRVVHSGLQGLITRGVHVRGNNRKAIVMSVSIADVNECGTQLVLCDVNADCVNELGSYSCRCRSGFQDKSRLGSGGTVCVDVKAAGCSSGLSAETKGVYVLFFLLSSLVLMLLAAAGLLYHRHHRGAFLVRCHSSVSPPDPNNNHHHLHDDGYAPADSDLPPPPPPARGFREGWPQVKERCPAVDLPLLRFSALLPPEESGKM